MGKSLGDFDASTVIYGKFTTYRPSTGASFTLGGTPALSVYKDNSTTQSTSGVTLTADFDSVTGLNHFAIDTSSDGTFYSAGSFFDIVITTGTVDSVSVTGSVVASFTIRKNSSLKPATAGRTLVVDAAGLADATTVKLGPSGSGTAQTARDIGASVLLSNGTGTGQLKLASGYVAMTWADIGSPTSAVNLSGTNIALAGGVSGNVSGDVGGNVIGSVGSVVGGVGGDLTGSVLGDVSGSVFGNLFGSIFDKTGYSLAADAVNSTSLAASAANEIADALLDRSNGVETGMTPRQSLRLISSATGAKLSGGATTTNTFRNAVADSKDRIVATVDSDGNRTAITYDLT